MYKERRDKASIKFYVLIALIVLIIVFAIILLMPHKKKKPVKKVELVLYSKYDMDDIKADKSSSFYDNFKNFKDASEKYFIKKASAIKNKQTVTLDSLINDNHYLATLTDDDGNKCDEEKSKVEFTKNSNNANYKEVITLICGKEEATISTYIGEYDYCDDKYCEKKREKKKKATKKEEPNPIVIPEPTEEPDPTPITDPTPTPEPSGDNYTLYEYVLSPNDSIGNWSDWSEWSPTAEEPSLYKEIETKVEAKTVEYDCSEGSARYITGYREEKYIAGYVTTTKVVGQKREPNGRVVNIYETTKEPVYGTKKTPIYGTRPAIQKTCTKEEGENFYRYRIFSYKKGINYVKYSSSDNDQYLISQGYVKTDKTR